MLPLRYPGSRTYIEPSSPGSQHVRFFSTVGKPIDDTKNPPRPEGPPDVRRLVTVGHECGIDFLPPPGGE